MSLDDELHELARSRGRIIRPSGNAYHIVHPITQACDVNPKNGLPVFRTLADLRSFLTTLQEAHMAKEPSVDEFLTKQKDALHEKRKPLLDQLAEIDGELAKIDAYFSAGKSPRKAEGTPKRTSGVKEKLLKIIQDHPQGLKKAAVIEAWTAAGNPPNNSLSNALSTMKKDGKITQVDGLYKAA